MEKLQKISFARAVKMIKAAEGYKTDLHEKHTFSPGWLKLDKAAKKIMFRYYKGLQGFTWSEWYEIEYE